VGGGGGGGGGGGRCPIVPKSVGGSVKIILRLCRVAVGDNGGKLRLQCPRRKSGFCRNHPPGVRMLAFRRVTVVKCHAKLAKTNLTRVESSVVCYINISQMAAAMEPNSSDD